MINEISSQAGVNYGLMAASVVLVVVPVLIVFTCCCRRTHQGIDRRCGQGLMTQAVETTGLWYNNREGESR
ncbi:MAG: hypothetical protein R2881_09100 [Eubacteriales bacterium]